MKKKNKKTEPDYEKRTRDLLIPRLISESQTKTVQHAIMDGAMLIGTVCVCAALPWATSTLDGISEALARGTGWVISWLCMIAIMNSLRDSAKCFEHAIHREELLFMGYSDDSEEVKKANKKAMKKNKAITESNWDAWFLFRLSVVWLFIVAMYDML